MFLSGSRTFLPTKAAASVIPASSVRGDSTRFSTAPLRLAWSDHARLFMAIGFVGAYTTFSTFEWETLQLIAEGSRYRAAAVPATVLSAGGGTVTLGLETPVRAITPGQSGVLYGHDGQVLGGGVIA